MKQTFSRDSSAPGSRQTNIRERWAPVSPPDTVAKRIAKKCKVINIAMETVLRKGLLTSF